MMKDLIQGTNEFAALPSGHPGTCPNCQKLVDRIEVLEAVLADKYVVPICFMLSPSETTIFAAVLKRERMTRVGLADILYGTADEPETALTVIATMMHHIRRKIRPFDISIQTWWGNGWFMLPAEKEKVRQLRSNEIGAVA